MKKSRNLASSSMASKRKKLKTEADLPAGGSNSEDPVEFDCNDILSAMLEDSDEDVGDFESDNDYWRSSDSEESETEEKPGVSSDEEHDSRDESNRSGSTVELDWNDDPSSMQHHEFARFESLLVVPPEARPLEYFRLMLTNELLDKIVKDTNINALDILMSEKTKEQSRICHWKQLTVEEFLVFLGVLLHMGNVKMTKLQDYWKKDSLFRIKGIAMSMGRNRFLIILRALHFYSGPIGGDETDKICKIQPLIDHFNGRMNELFYPGRELNMDEPMILCWDRVGFRQFINNDRRKHGFKFHLLTNPSGLIQKFTIHRTHPSEQKSRDHVSTIVLSLMEEKLNVGHHLYLHEYYSSFELVKALLSKKTLCTGMLQFDSKYTPNCMRNIKLKKGVTIARYSGGIMMGKWKKKRNLSYISSGYENIMVKVENKANEKKSKPVPIIEFRKHMPGIDRHNLMQSFYLSDRKTIRWSTKIFVHILEMMVFNTHFLFNKYSGKKMPLFDYRLSIIKDLLPSFEEPLPILNMPLVHTLSKRGPTPGRKHTLRKKCKTCTREGRRTDTIYECMTCPDEAGYCLNCSVIFHK